ncbi:fatty acyl-AMP ligase [Saccharothrix syringae]|uniref:Long-chain fatty acid--CoA ligase n=1 Tax=Saccharothrix syringae TaxID=103733 RepID=A0A5Q0GRE1_SACSY|nr:fatty acyl-AMP ligase [Saccharothrix syringae]QFZ16646.1 long-chain fatty acid--CoA ligase [Saccharothrix syringae]
MSRFVDTMVATAAGALGRARGMTTGEPGDPVRRSWLEVHERATRAAGALVAGGVARGDSIAVLAGDPAAIAPTVQAVWLAGASTTMLHQPTARTDLAEWAEDTLRVLNMIDAKLVLLGAPFDALAGVLEQHGVAYRRLEELDGDPLPAPVEVDEDLPALLQLTSGSTADPKAVRITHGNLWSNATAMRTAAALDPESDVMVSWLPLFHDMGMVGFLTVPMLFGIDLVKVTPADFLARPTLWPDLISRYGGTITAAPNFAYAIVARRTRNVDDGAFDLSRLRIALNGAEPIDPAAVRAFTDEGARFGLRPECVLCAYGMAETALGVAFAPVFTGMAVDVVDPEELEAGKHAVPVDPGHPNARAFPLLGPPLPGLEVQVVDEAGAVLGERRVGRLRVRGEAVTPGYLTVDGPVATRDAEGWLDTGDEGYLVDGQVVVCGRRKDVIIMGGRNIYPTDIERAATSVEGVRAGNAVAVRLDAGTRRERFAVVVESRLAGDDEAVRALSKEVGARVVDAVGLRPFSVVVLKPGSLPKTPSGKLRRAAAASLVPAAG